MLRTVDSGPDVHCDPEQVSFLFWVSVSHPVKRGYQYKPPRAGSRKGGSPGSACQGGTKLLAALSGQAHSRRLGGQPAGAVVSM